MFIKPNRQSIVQPHNMYSHRTQDLLWRRGINARNISTQISLWWPNYLVNSADKTKHSVHMHSQLIIVFIVISKIFIRVIIAFIFQNRAPGSGATSRPKPGTFHLEIHFFLISSYYGTANSPRLRVPYLQGKWLQSSDCITSLLKSWILK